jgi:pyroglutamyl-peptidase
MPDLLITGFAPFGGFSANSSEEVVHTLEDRSHRSIAAAVLPVEYLRSLIALREAIVEADPRVVISLGQAEGRKEICVETVATASGGMYPDEAGLAADQPAPSRAASGEALPATYLSTLPVGRIAACLEDAGIPVALSRDAGSYVCNHLFYELMHILATERPTTIGGFVHLPILPERSMPPGVGGMKFATMVHAVDLIVRVVQAELVASG